MEKDCFALKDIMEKERFAENIVFYHRFLKEKDRFGL
jgi:hypothetical protein